MTLKGFIVVAFCGHCNEVYAADKMLRVEKNPQESKGFEVLRNSSFR